MSDVEGEGIHWHVCPACGKQYECSNLYVGSFRDGVECHTYWPLPCSKKCHEQMNAVVDFIRRRLV